MSLKTKTIDMYFTSAKRKGDENQPDKSTVDKKRKTDDDDDEPKQFTTEQIQGFHNNKMTARLKLLSKRTNLIEPGSVGLSWMSKVLDEEFRKPYFQALDEFYGAQVKAGKIVFPKKPDIFSWTRYTDVCDVKVVVVGQDPYHGVGQAHGLCFSVNKGVAVPPSLLNMYKELSRDDEVEFDKPGHGSLEGWAKQGVLLLNAVLTVESGKANSHRDRGWETLTSNVIKWVSDNLPHVVFLLWGAFAQKHASVVNNRKHTVLKTVHPSPLSAHKGFIGCGHFSECNRALTEHGQTPVNWNEL